MRRVAFYLFYDNDGIVDDYIIYKLRMLRAHVETIFLVSNSKITSESLEKLNSVVDVVHCRENKGFDVWAYKDAIETFGWDNVRKYDEAILLNYTFFGPIFPFSELFESMDKPGIDFWGISAHQKVTPNPFNGAGYLPYHIQSHFIAVRKEMLNSESFYHYWADMPMINSYEDSILKHEARFTEHFSQLGFNFAVSIAPETYNTDHPIFSEMDLAIERRSPIIKRRPFFHDPVFVESEAIDVKRALDLVSESSDYDVSLIWKNLIRTTPLRTLYSNLEVLSVLSETQVEVKRDVPVSKKLAVIAHVYYVDMLEELLGYMKNIPSPFSIYITTDSQEKKDVVEDFFSARPEYLCTVLVCESNFGRDTSALFITCRDIVLSGGYDLICRLHSKKSPQDGWSKASMFKRHLCENLLASPEYVRNIIDMFETQPWVGIAMPPVVHIGYPTLGHGWFLNRERAVKLARELDFKVPLDHETPIATYGSMYWFRPQALKKLFDYNWKWSDFDEHHYGDGDLPHVLERLITYCAQDAGFLSRCIMTPNQISKNYVKLEYKLQALSSCFSTGSLREQMQIMQIAKTSQITYITTGVIMSLKRSIMHRYPRLGSVLRRVYRWLSDRR